jgi:hypothetical protein
MRFSRDIRRETWRNSIIDACFSRPEIPPADIQSTNSIASFTSNSHNNLPRIDLVHYFVKPPRFPSVRQKHQIWL